MFKTNKHTTLSLPSPPQTSMHIYAQMRTPTHPTDYLNILVVCAHPQTRTRTHTTHTHTLTHTQTHTQIRTHTHTHTYERKKNIRTHERPLKHAHTHAPTHSRTHARTYVGARTLTHKCLLARMYTRIHKHKHTHAHTHIHHLNIKDQPLKSVDQKNTLRPCLYP